VLAGYGVTFISRAAVEADLATGALAEARVAGMNGRREISLARGTGRLTSRIADAFATFAQGRAAVLGGTRAGEPR
jgi:DNA-binding transcriptional LysR family regulator